MFTFLRKLAGAGAVFLAMLVLDLAGLEKGAQQSDGALLAVRIVATCGPAFFLALGLWFARGYPLTRARHAEILDELSERAVERK